MGFEGHNLVWPICLSHETAMGQSSLSIQLLNPIANLKSKGRPLLLHPAVALNGSLLLCPDLLLDSLIQIL